VKIIVAISRNLTIPEALNATGHALFGLCTRCNDSTEMREFLDQAGRSVATMTDFPLICMSARNEGHLKEFHDQALGAGLSANGFFKVMYDGSPEEQETIIRSTPASALAYGAVAALGPSDLLRQLSKRFSLLRDADLRGSA
jgi:hypothetical protein